MQATNETTTATKTNGTNKALTIGELAGRPAHQLTRKQFGKVRPYAAAMQNVSELEAKREHFITQAAALETEIEEAKRDAKTLGEEIYE